MAVVLGRKGGGSGGGGGAPSGPAGGSLGGTYPNPSIANLAVDTAQIAAGAVTAAKVAADVATQAELDAAVAAVGTGWNADSATWTFASASTFTVTGDRTSVFTTGTRLRFTQTTVKYGVVASSSHAAGTTTVTIIVNTDYVLANAAISATSYSYQENPQGYPGWFTWAPAPTGYSPAPTIDKAKFSVVGRTCSIQVYCSGTSNATTLTMTPPTPAANVFTPHGVISGTDNGSALANPARIDMNASVSTMRVFKDLTTASWTNTGTKAFTAFWSYEI